MGATRASKKQLKKERKKAAEEVCWTLLLMMAVGSLDLPDEDRKWLSTSMQKWSDLAHKTGQLPDDPNDS